MPNHINRIHFNLDSMSIQRIPIGDFSISLSSYWIWMFNDSLYLIFVRERWGETAREGERERE